MKISVVVPTKNEELTIQLFIEWCFEGFKAAEVEGEVIIADFSSDKTCALATQFGAKVVKLKKPGLGFAYSQAKLVATGNIILLGDADCTYDFREIQNFISAINSGLDLVIGSRFAGEIEPGAMPALHRYFGSPLTTFIFRKLLRINLTDIHCGMRALKIDLFRALPFNESGWEYASEMIATSKFLGANIGEIPIKFLKSPNGRISHQVRNGFTAPFKAGWGTLRIIFANSVDKFLVIPGIILFALGLVLNVSRLILSILENSIINGIASSFGFLFLSLFGFIISILGLISRNVFSTFNPEHKNIFTKIDKSKGFLWIGILSIVLIVLGLIDLYIVIKFDWIKLPELYVLIFQSSILLFNILVPAIIFLIIGQFNTAVGDTLTRSLKKLGGSYS